MKEDIIKFTPNERPVPFWTQMNPFVAMKFSLVTGKTFKNNISNNFCKNKKKMIKKTFIFKCFCMVFTI